MLVEKLQARNAGFALRLNYTHAENTTIYRYAQRLGKIAIAFQTRFL
jgi:hypothetical protein